MAQFLVNEKFGNGSGGAVTLSGTDAPVDAQCSGTSGTFTLSATNSSFAANQIIRIKQMRGTGSGQWELNVIASYSSGTITTKYPLDYTYASDASGGNNKSTVVVVNQYGTITHTGTLTCKTWNQNPATGGEVIIMSNRPFTSTGTFALNTAGFNMAFATPAHQGEGTGGFGSSSESANGNGGSAAADRGGAGGGANAANGSTGGNGSGSADPNGRVGGTAAGSANLTTMVMGGEGGSGKFTPWQGGRGGAMLTIIAPTIDISGATITCNGEDGSSTTGSGTDGACGGGAGGSVLLIGRDSVALGTNRVNLAVGSGGSGTGAGAGAGGAGSLGRLAVWGPTSSIVSGSNSPAHTFLANNNVAGGAQFFAT